MTESHTQKFHPREVELARQMAENGDIEWEVQTGDWFYYDGQHHTVFQVEGDGEDAVLIGQNANRYKQSEVVPLRHRTDCREWLLKNDYDIEIQNLPDDQYRAIARKRKTEFAIERIEPTELAAFYSVLLEIGEIRHMGGWG